MLEIILANNAAIQHIVYDIINLALCLLIFFRAKDIFAETKNPQMIIISAGFLTVAFLDVFHTISIISFFATTDDRMNILSDSFIILRDLYLSLSVFIPFFITEKHSEIPYFKKNVYKTYFLSLSLVSLALLLFSQLSSAAFQFYLTKYFFSIPLLEIIDNALLILAFVILFDIKKIAGQKIFSPLMLSLLVFIGLIEIPHSYVKYSPLMTSIFHLIFIAGLLLFRAGLKELKYAPKIINIRQKLIISPAVLLIIFSTLFLFIDLVFFNIVFPINIEYIFFGLFVSLIIVAYFLSYHLVTPLLNTVKSIEKFKPDTKPEIIPITSNDEIGLLTEEINRKAKLSWEYSQTLKEEAQQEFLLREIISIMGRTFDRNEIKNKIVTTIANILKPDVSFIIEFDNENQKYIPVEKGSEYLSSEDLKSFVGVNISEIKGFNYIQELHTKGENIIYSDVDKFIEEEGLKGTDTEKVLKYFEINSLLAMNLIYRGEFLGNLVIQYAKEKKEITKDYVEYVQILADQAAIAIYQSKLYDLAKTSADKEFILRKSVETIRSQTTIKMVTKTLTKIIGETFKSRTCEFYLYDEELDEFVAPNPKDSYFEESDVREARMTLRWKNYPDVHDLFKAGKDFIFSSKEECIRKYMKKQSLEESLQAFARHDVGANVAVSILSPDNKNVGVLCFTYREEKNISNDIIDFTKTLATQAGIAIYQIRLLEQEKAVVLREKLLKDIALSIRETLDINKMKSAIVKKVGEAFNFDSCAIIQFDNENKKFLPLDKYSLYLSMGDIGHHLGMDLEKPNLKAFKKFFQYEDKELIISDVNNPPSDIHPKIIKILQEYEIKSTYTMLIKYQNELLGVLYANYVDEPKTLKAEDIELLHSITGQAGIGLYQSMLYEKTKEQAQREQITRTLQEIIRSTLDIDEFKRVSLRETGRAFGANRCFFRIFNKEENKYILPTNEYLSSPKIKSIKKASLSQEALKKISNIIFKTDLLNISNVKEYIKKQKLENTELEKYFIDAEIKSDYSVAIWDVETEKVYIVLQYTEKVTRLTKDDMEMFKSLAKQINVGFQQAMLFSEIAEKEKAERTLREVIAELKFSRNLEEIYSYILKTITTIFDTAMVCFFDPPAAYIKLERSYLQEGRLVKSKEEDLPKEFLDTIEKVKKTGEIIAVEDVNAFFKESRTKAFFRKLSRKSIVFAPLIRYEKEKKSQGIIVLCSLAKRHWAEKEINMLKSIIDITATAIGEASKLKEIEDLRNAFILTLAHDFQVPLVGERTALEFLLSRGATEPIGKFREFIAETIQSNKDLSDLIVKLLDIYNYESGRKKLTVECLKIDYCLEHVLKSVEELREAKNIEIELNIEEAIHCIKADFEEIIKPLYTIIENALTYSLEDTKILISAKEIKKEIELCVKDEGVGITDEMKEIIFKRYETAEALERKIGSGVPLYLAKKIVEAHKGTLYFISEIGKGTTFCIKLPMGECLGNL